jgi:uroporphyrinogen III methyltransferase/synthase
MSEEQTLPLTGRRILMTRARHQSDVLGDLLREKGAEAIDAPAIRIEDPPDWAEVDRAVEQIDSYDYVIMTSQNTLPRLRSRFEYLGIPFQRLDRAEIVAIGEATAQAIRESGLRVDRMPHEYRAEAVVDLFTTEELENKRVLLPRALVAREELPRGLEEKGAIVEVVPVYQTLPDTEGAKIARTQLAAGVDAVTFTASSTVQYFVQSLTAQKEIEPIDLLQQICLASIGPITSESLRSHGLEPTVQADPYTVEGLVSVLVQHFVEMKEKERE